MPDVVKMLRGLHEAATKGPWAAAPVDRTNALWVFRADDPSRRWIADVRRYDNAGQDNSTRNANALLIATLRTLLPELIGDQEASARLASAADALAATDDEAFSHMAAQAEFDAALDAWKDARRALATAAAAVEKEVRP